MDKLAAHYWILLKALLVPSALFFKLILVLLGAGTGVFLLVFVAGNGWALMGLNTFWLLCLSIVLLVVPERLSQLLVCRSFALCGQAPRLAANLVAALMALWSLWAVASLLGFASIGLFIKCLSVVWLLSSVFMAVCTYFRFGYFAFVLSMFFLGNLADQIELTAVIATLPVLSAVIPLALTLLLWRRVGGLTSLSPAGEVSIRAFQLGDKWGESGGGLFPRVTLARRRSPRVAQLALASNRPFWSLFIIMSGLIVGWCLVIGVYQVYQGHDFWSWLLAPERHDNPFFTLIIMAMVSALHPVQNTVKKIRRFWLLLPGTRGELWRDLEPVLWGIMASVYVPLMLFALLLYGAGAVTAVSLVQTGAVLVMASTLFTYWLVYNLGNESMTLLLVNVVAYPALIAACFVVSLNSVDHAWVSIAVVGTLAVLAIGVRQFALAHWLRLDITQLRVEPRL